MSNTSSTAIANLAEVVQRVTRILSDREIKVIQQGMKVGVEYDHQGAPTKVFLPSITDNPNPELVVAIQGFLDKEVSTLLYTDFNTRHKRVTDPDFKRQAAARAIQEIIEDARTERVMRQNFKGSASNFDKNHDFAVKEILGPMLEEAKSEPEKMAALAYPAIRAACGDMAYQEYMDGKWEELGKLGGAILHYADDIQRVESTGDTFDLTRKIIEKMQEQDPPEEEECDGDGEGEGDGDEEGDEGSGVGFDDEDSGDDADAGGMDDSADLASENKSTELRKAADKGNKGQPGGSKNAQGLAQFSELESAFQDLNFDTKVADRIRKIAGTDATASGAYVPWSRAYDYTGPLPDIESALRNYSRSTHGQSILHAADSNSHVIQNQIQKLFMAREMKRWEPGQKRGRLNPASLYKLSQGDPRVFRRKIETQGRDVAVALVIDMSGSMSGSKVQNACIAALMFSKVLTALGIKHEISAFSTYTGHYRGSSPTHPNSDDINKAIQELHYGAAETVDGKTVRYSRVTPICNYILKPWQARMTEDHRRTIAMIPSQFDNLMSGNVDGESVEAAGRRLLCQNEKKKVMIVMSDGCPASDGHGGHLVQHLKDTVKGLSASGIEMLGLGLQDASVQSFYPKSEVVHKTDQIPSKILELTRKMVIGV